MYSGAVRLCRVADLMIQGNFTVPASKWYQQWIHKSFSDRSSSSLLCRFLGQTDAFLMRKLQFILFCCQFSLLLFFGWVSLWRWGSEQRDFPPWKHLLLENRAAHFLCQKPAVNEKSNPLTYTCMHIWTCKHIKIHTYCITTLMRKCHRYCYNRNLNHLNRTLTRPKSLLILKHKTRGHPHFTPTSLIQIFNPNPNLMFTPCSSGKIGTKMTPTCQEVRLVHPKPPHWQTNTTFTHSKPAHFAAVFKVRLVWVPF